MISIITVGLMIITTLSGCAVLQKLGLQQKDNEEISPVSSIVMNEDEVKKQSDKFPISLYFLTEDSSKLKLEIRYIPISDAKKSAKSLAENIVKELIKGPSANTGLKPSIPSGTALRSVTITDTVATVDFSKEFVDKHPGGKNAEQLTLYSVVNSLTEMKDVQKVKFTINGKPQADFKGNFKFDVAFPRNTALISKEASSVNSGTANINSKGQDTNQPSSTKKTDTKPQNLKQKETKPQETKQQDTKSSTDKAKEGGTKATGSNAANNPATGEGDAEETYLQNLE